MTKIRPQQLKALHTILQRQGMKHMKEDLVLDATRGRTKSSRELTCNEATALINGLNDSEPKEGDRMRKKILAICHDMKWYLPKTKKLDFERIDDFLTSKHGTGKKLMAMNERELNKAVGMFQGLRNSQMKKPTKFEADGQKEGSE